MKKTILYKLIVAGFIAFSMQSCFVAKDYERPEFEELNTLYRTDNLSNDSISAASISWKELFTDPYLRGYIEKGLNNNLDIRIAIQQMNAAEAYMKQGKAGYLPSLSVNANLTYQELASNSQFGAFFDGALQQYELSGRMAWEADIWGKIRSNRRASEAGYLQSVAAHQAVKTMLVSQISSVYYQLLSLDEQLRVTEETIANRAKSLETIKALKEAGNVTQVAVDQTSAQLYNAEALLVDIRTAIYRSENTLSILLAETPHEIERSKLEDQQLDSDLKTGVPALLLRNRPDVMAAEFALRNSFELTNVAKSNFYPSLTLSGTGGFQSLEFRNWLDSGSLFATLAGGLAQPLFNKRSIRTQYEVARAQQEQALLNFRKSLLTAGKEVSEALYNYKAESEKYDLKLMETAALKRAESNSEELLNSGFANYLDLLTARQNVLAAELNLIDSKLRQLTSIVTLYRSLGGGWK